MRHRVINWPRKQFLEVLWCEGRFEKYMRQIDAFFQRRVLLVHITSGQPARATELLGLRHHNTLQDSHRLLAQTDSVCMETC
jgi:hypothetical protein